MRHLLLLPLLLLPFPAFAESLPEGIEGSNSEYLLVVDGHEYSIPYKVDANVLAMAIDPELNSLLIGLENTKDSVFEIRLLHEVISAQNNEFMILVNGNDVDYNISSDADSTTLSFYVPEFTEEVEIVGTHVVPEFPFGAILGLTIMITLVIVLARKGQVVTLSR
jgi:predicted secreted protein with PEFG-CTERM motif